VANAPYNPDPAGEPALFIPAVVVAAIAVLVGLFALQFLMPAENYRLLVVYLAFLPAYGLHDPLALASLVTHSLLHVDATHLVVNLVWLVAFGSPLAARLGPLRFIAFWAVTAAAGALAFHAWNPAGEGLLIGASGAISGMTGAAARFAFRVDRRRRPAAFAGAPLPLAAALANRNVLLFVAVWMVLNLVAGLGLLTGAGTGPIAWQAHVGGFIAGFLLLALFDRRNAF